MNKLRKLLLIPVLAGLMVACSDPHSPRFPQPEKEDDPEKSDGEQTGFRFHILEADSTPV